MRKLSILIISLFSFVTISKSQNHILGVGSGYSTFEPPVYINYQYSYRWLNSKIKVSVLPFGMHTTSWSLTNDYYIGIKTEENKKNVFNINIGASILLPRTGKYANDINQQINPIIDFGYAFLFNKNNRITSDFSISQYSMRIPTKSSSIFSSLLLFNIEVGYAYTFNKKNKL